MRMSIWWGYDIGDFLFYGYRITTVGALLATCAGVGALAVLFEWCKLMQAKHRQRQLSYRAEQIRSICPTENATLLDAKRSSPDSFHISLRKRLGLPFFDAFIWLFLHNMGYLLMLTVMVYNGWIFVSVVLGSGFGYFIFGQSFMKINLKNCQLMRNAFCAASCSESEMLEEQRDGESTPALQSSSTSEIPSCHNETVATVHASTSSSGVTE